MIAPAETTTGLVNRDNAGDGAATARVLAGMAAAPFFAATCLAAAMGAAAFFTGAFFVGARPPAGYLLTTFFAGTFLASAFGAGDFVGDAIFAAGLFASRLAGPCPNCRTANPMALACSSIGA